MDIDKSYEENQVLLAKGGKRNNYGDKFGRYFQPRDMSYVKCHYYQ